MKNSYTKGTPAQFVSALRAQIAALSEDTAAGSVTSSSNFNLFDYGVDNKLQRYIHTLMRDIADLLEDEGYDVEFEENDSTLMISIFPQGEERCEGTYSFPKSSLDCDSFDTCTDASNIVEILMNRAHFEDFYACDAVLSSSDVDTDDEWTYLTSKSVPDSDGFMTDYTMYVNEFTGEYMCILGDNDAYGPDENYADFTCDSEEEAYEWFNSYNGFDDEASYTVIDTKYILDSNNNRTLYTMFRDIDSGEYVFVVGTDDPDEVSNNNIDWIASTEAEAWGWFEDYGDEVDDEL